MSATEIIGLFVGLCTLLGFLGKLIMVISKLNYTIQNTNSSFSRIEDDFNSKYKHNSESHKKIWEHNADQDDRIEDHEVRISIIEEKNNVQVGRRNKK